MSKKDKIEDLLKAVLAEMESTSENNAEDNAKKDSLAEKAAEELAKKVAEVAHPALKRFDEDGKMTVLTSTGVPGTVITSKTWLRIIQNCVMQYGLALAAEAQVIGYDKWVLDRFAAGSADTPEAGEDAYQRAMSTMIKLLVGFDLSD